MVPVWLKKLSCFLGSHEPITQDLRTGLWLHGRSVLSHMGKTKCEDCEKELMNGRGIYYG